MADENTKRNHIYQHGVRFVKGIGHRTLRKWLDRCSLHDLYTNSGRELHALLGQGILVRKWIAQRSAAIDMGEKTMQENAHPHVWFQDPNFPTRLNRCPDAPLLLHYSGTPTWNHPRLCAVVGTRTPDEDGLQLTHDLIRFLHHHNIGVVSGLAYGIDIQAHRCCNALHHLNFAVLGSGLGNLYPPSHKKDAEAITKNGALLSEFTAATKPDRENFPQRNRIIAGMVDLLIVVQSKQKGGALITAQLALDYNREVGAIPGSLYAENHAGCNHLIAQSGCFCVADFHQILDQMGWNTDTPQLQLEWETPEFPEKYTYLLPHFKNGIVHLDVLAEETHQPVQTLNTDLFFLELEGLVRSLPGNRYRLA